MTCLCRIALFAVRYVIMPIWASNLLWYVGLPCAVLFIAIMTVHNYKALSDLCWFDLLSLYCDLVQHDNSRLGLTHIAPMSSDYSYVNMSEHCGRYLLTHADVANALYSVRKAWHLDALTNETVKVEIQQFVMCKGYNKVSCCTKLQHRLNRNEQNRQNHEAAEN